MGINIPVLSLFLGGTFSGFHRVCFSEMPFLRLRKFLSSPASLSVSVTDQCCILPKAFLFFAAVEMVFQYYHSKEKESSDKQHLIKIFQGGPGSKTGLYHQQMNG